MSMSVGVEVRVPFLVDLVKHVSKIPSKYKQEKEGKEFEKIMENYLPKEIIYRPKNGLGFL